MCSYGINCSKTCVIAHARNPSIWEDFGGMKLDWITEICLRSKQGQRMVLLRVLVAFAEDLILVPICWLTTITLVQRNSTSSSDLCRHQAHSWYIHIKLTHIKLINLEKKSKRERQTRAGRRPQHGGEHVYKPSIWGVNSLIYQEFKTNIRSIVSWGPTWAMRHPPQKK